MNSLEILAKSGEAAKSGPIGFAVILVLCVVCYFLFKSMSKHLKNVREQFPVNRQAPPPTVRTERTSQELNPAPRADGDADGDKPPPGHA
jgi:hypothetical protein